MKLKYFWIFFFVSLALLYSWYQSQKLSTLVKSDETQLILKELPAVELNSLTGESVNLHNYMDINEVELLVVHFWGTWCAPCEAEFPELIKLAIKFKEEKKVKFLFVAVDDEEIKIKKFIKRFEQVYPGIELFLDNTKIHRDKFGTARVPETYFFNKMKKTVKKFAGAMNWQSEYYYKLIDELIY